MYRLQLGVLIFSHGMQLHRFGGELLWLHHCFYAIMINIDVTAGYDKKDVGGE